MFKKSNKMFKELPEEILMEILLYVAASDLQNFKLVSKLWNFLISNPNFGNSHFNQFQSQSQFILFESLTKPSYLVPKCEYHQFSMGISLKSSAKELHFPSFPQSQTENVFSLKASCDGLLLFQNKYYPKQLYISNPLTARFNPLPRVFSTCKDWVLVRDNSLNKYKAFAVHSDFVCQYITLEDCSSTWKTCCPGRLKYPAHNVLSQPVVFQNQIHWLTTDTDDTDQLFCYFIYSVHVETVTFSKTKVPFDVLPLCEFKLHDFEKRQGQHLITEVEGLMCLTFVTPSELQMFVLEDRVNCLWTKSHRSRLQSLMKPPPLSSFLSDDTCLFAMKGFARENIGAHVKVLVHYDDHLLLYDFKTQETTPMGFLSKERKIGKSYFFHSHSLVTLASLN
ncbi:hypothetical protein ACHQM5_008993 [Ranunculus cassubicifolius]